MSFLLKHLEKQIPSAKLLIQDSVGTILEDNSEDIWNQGGWEKIDFLCIYGISSRFYALARTWLDENDRRRLVFIEEKPEALSQLLEDDDAILLLNDLRVKLYFLETPLQIEPIAKKVAWTAVFKEMAYFVLREGDYSLSFQKELEKGHLAAHLLLSEAADWGCSIFENAKANRKIAARSGMDLKGKFANIPAIIVGAGPSLEKNGHLLKAFEQKGLILAGGAALNVIEAEPHFAASIDKEAPYRQFKMHRFFETPFCFQSRTNRENAALIHGEALLFPDGSADWINWINDQKIEFETGWTVGNFLTSLALFLGCSPIILVGMDLCYRQERKYAHIDSFANEGLVKILDVNGKAVWSQRDWIMSARWTEELAAKNLDVDFINATEGGIGFDEPVRAEPLSEVLKRLNAHSSDLREKVHAEIQKLPLLPSNTRWKEWDESMNRCNELCNEFRPLDLEALEKEIAYEKLLDPLWQIWKPIFERELDLDPQPISMSDKLRLNQLLFFQQVLQEHSNA